MRNVMLSKAASVSALSAASETQETIDAATGELSDMVVMTRHNEATVTALCTLISRFGLNF